LEEGFGHARAPRYKMRRNGITAPHRAPRCRVAECGGTLSCAGYRCTLLRNGEERCRRAGYGTSICLRTAFLWNIEHFHRWLRKEIGLVTSKRTPANFGSNSDQPTDGGPAAVHAQRVDSRSRNSRMKMMQRTGRRAPRAPLRPSCPRAVSLPTSCRCYPSCPSLSPRRSRDTFNR